MLMTFFGDDFTGSTDVMEALSLSGVRTVLFVQPPTPAQLAAFPGVQAVGVAGTTRSMPPDAMAAHLPQALEALARLDAPVVHYKVCSTLDSSPTRGSIGRAIDLACDVLDPAWVPIVIGVPVLGRYVAFANLFARSGLDSEALRLDRHPTMTRHPVTPIDESDIRLHLARQSDRRITSFDLTQLDRPDQEIDAAFASLIGDGRPAVLFDTTREAHLDTIGRLLWEHRDSRRPLLAVGSSGVEYALVRHWRRMGLIEKPAREPQPGAVDQVVVVSGSLSPVTGRQIDAAVSEGFAEVSADTVRLADPADAGPEVARCIDAAVSEVREGRSVVVHLGRGPADPRIAPTQARLHRQGLASGPVMGAALGEIVKGVSAATRLPRFAVTGGDTSGFAAAAMSIHSLEFAGRLAPGAPLCVVGSTDPAIDGRQIVFKGGQVGYPDFFTSVLAGCPGRVPELLRKDAE